MKKILLFIVFISIFGGLLAESSLNKQDIRKLISQELEQQTTKESLDLKLLQNMGNSLQTYSILTYSGLLFSVVGGFVYKDNSGIGTGFMIIGGVVSLIAPSFIGKAGKEIQNYADNELKRLQNTRNHSIDQFITPEITTPKNNEIYFVNEFVNINIRGDKIESVYCWSSTDDADAKYLKDYAPPWNFIKKFGHKDIGNVTVYLQVNLTNGESKNLQVTFKVIKKD